MDRLRGLLCTQPYHRTKDQSPNLTIVEADALLDSNSEYDLEVSCRILRDPQSSYDRNLYRIILAFKSPNDYLGIHVSLDKSKWTLLRIENGEVFTIAEQNDDKLLKLNIFCDILIQIRGTLVTVDVNGHPIFTSVRVPMNNVSGYVGMWIKDSKCAFKGWKLSRKGVNQLSSGVVGSTSPPSNPTTIGHGNGHNNERIRDRERDKESLWNATTTMFKSDVSLKKIAINYLCSVKNFWSVENK